MDTVWSTWNDLLNSDCIMAEVLWQDAFERLKKGNERFIADKLDGKLQDSNRRKRLTGGQNPFAIILTCSDSRVVPELTFDTGLGELFVIRVAGNVANTSSIASIEYAVAHLGVKLIVVMGHESCGAVTAAMQGGDNGYNLNHLLGHVTPAVEAAKGESVNVVVKTNAKLTSGHLRERSSIIENAVQVGGLRIMPAYYNLKDGKVDFYELDSMS